MKKTYIAPVAEVIKMKYTTLLNSISNTPAEAGSAAMGREAELDFDEEY